MLLLLLLLLRLLLLLLLLRTTLIHKPDGERRRNTIKRYKQDHEPVRARRNASPNVIAGVDHP